MENVKKEMQKRQNIAAIQRAFDAVAQAKGYGNCLHLCKYCALPESAKNKYKFHKENADAFLLWTLDVWEKANEYLETLGENDICFEEDAINEIPDFQWPDGTIYKNFVFDKIRFSAVWEIVNAS